MKKCKVCGKRLALRRGLRYEVTVLPVGMQILTEHPKTYECFDCLYCGCQNVVNVREVGGCEEE